MKLNQTIGADSWIIYRKKHTFNMLANTTYRIDFVPLIAGSFVARAYQETNIFVTGDIYFYPDPNINGRWWTGRNSTTTDVTMLVFSTREGTISHTPS